MSQNQPFNHDEFAKWLVEGVKETLGYRLKQTFNREQLIELLKSKIPTRGQLMHQALKQGFKKDGFEFEDLKQGDAVFHVIRKKIKKEGRIEKRLVLIPGFGDTPTSWIPTYAFCKKEIEANFDEVILVDFPGYSGFLSHAQMVPSMGVLLNVVQMVCDANPPTVLIGHSLGGALVGKVAQRLARPIDHLILVAPSGLTPEDEKVKFGDFILSMQHVPFEDLLQKMVHQPKKIFQLIRQEFQSFYNKPEVKEFITSFQEEYFIDPKKPFNAQRVSVIWGSDDQFVPSHWMRYWVECFGPYIDAYFIDKTGHLPQLERPKTMADLLKKVILKGAKASSSEKRWQKILTHTKSFLDNGPIATPNASLLTHSKP